MDHSGCVPPNLQADGLSSTLSMLQNKISFTVQVIIPIVIDGELLYLLVGSSCEIKGIVARHLHCLQLDMVDSDMPILLILL